jgi:cyclic pyranopterin phosphate synthase
VGMVEDRLGRGLRDLRVSVTDRCNFRCTYCMPREIFGPDHAFVPRAELLSFEEIARVAAVFAGLGVRKIRLTGGEPLLRRDLDRLVGMLVAIPGVDDLALTTNGVLLADRAAALRAAGLGRVTVSLDALDPGVFAAMADSTIPVERVIEGIVAAAQAGLGVKVNTVVQARVNEGELLPLAAFGREHGVTVRFIEYMDVGTSNGWELRDVVAAADMRATVDAAWPIEPVAPAAPGEVAERWRYRDGAGEVGFISSVTQPFCGDCTRARLSAVGELFTCLFAAGGHDLRPLLRGGTEDEALRARIAEVWAARDDRYSELRTEGVTQLPRVEMSYIGG